MTARYQNYVSGEWIGSRTNETFETTDPAAPAEVVAEYPQSSVDDANAAVEAAAAAQDDWADTAAPERGAILREAASILAGQKDDLTELLVREEGRLGPKPVVRSSAPSTSSTTTRRRPATSVVR